MADIFQKCIEFTRADDAKSKGVYPYFRAVQENEGPVVMMEGRKVIMAGSNNYLGLTAHPKVKEAAVKAIEKYGTSCSGSRYLTGTIDLHNELEHRLATYLGYESVLLFSTGYQTALGTISALVQKGDYVVSDKENHACIINGAMLAKGGFAEFVRYKHNDMDDLDRVLSRLPESAQKLVVTDGVFSVTGKIVNLPDLIAVAKKHGARVMVDDAHATGVIGEAGRGTANFYGLTAETDMTMGTFSKSFASLGGFVAGPERVINYIKHTSPGLIFSASPTPASVASALAALEIIEAEPWRVNKLIENANYARNGLRNTGFHVLDGQTGIVPVIIGEFEPALAFWKQLYDRDLFVNAFVPPGVPPNMSMMRTSYMASHETHHLDKIIDIFNDVAQIMGVGRN